MNVVCGVAMQERGHRNNQSAHSQPSDHDSDNIAGSASEATATTAAKGPADSAPCGVHVLPASPLDLRESSGAQVLRHPSKPFEALVVVHHAVGAECEYASAEFETPTLREEHLSLIHISEPTRPY